MAQWQIKTFSELTTIELFNLLYTRSEVFVVEQNCVFQEPTLEDLDCLHVFKTDEAGGIIAYGRIIDKGETVTFGRVITAPQHRGAGSGRELLTVLIAEITRRYPARTIEIQAQSYLEHFYGSFGFKACSAYYLEDEIEHVDMKKEG